MAAGLDLRLHGLDPRRRSGWRGLRLPVPRLLRRSGRDGTLILDVTGNRVPRSAGCPIAVDLISAGLRQRHISKFVDDQQLVTGELALQAQEPLVVAGLDQFVHERAAAVVKATDKPFWQAARPSPSAMWLLPVSELPVSSASRLTSEQ